MIGNGFDENVNFYLDEIGKYPLLTKEEEQLLAREVKRGNELARKHFIECNLRLVVKIAKRYFCKDLSLLDLIEEGNLGLMIAVDKYDEKCDTKFSTYAAFWIEEAIKEFAIYMDNPSGAIKVIDEYQEECERKRILAKEQRRLARL